MRSKYTRRERKTSLVVGQYLRIRKRYASNEIVGTFRAWKARVAEGVPRATRDALVSEFHTGCVLNGRWLEVGEEEECGGGGLAVVLLSFEIAIEARAEARSLRRSDDG